MPMKRILRIAGVLVALLILLFVVLPLFFNANRFKPALEAEMTKALGRQVTVADLSLSLLSGAVTAKGLSIADDPAFHQGPFLTAKKLSVGVNLLPLIFSHRLSAKDITIDQPEIVLLQSPAGDWNFSRMGGQDPPAQPVANAGGNGLDLSVKVIKINDGRVTMGKAGDSAQPFSFENVNAAMRNFSSSTAMPFSLSGKFSGGGEMTMEGTAGPIHPGDMTLTPAQVSVKVSHLDLALAGVVAGETGMGGIISLEGKAASNGQNASVTGSITAEQLKLVKGGSPAKKTVQFDFDLVDNLSTRSGTLQRGDLHIGTAVASLTGTFQREGQATVLNAMLSGSNMPVPELETMLPALNVVLPAGSSLKGGTASVRLAVAGPTDQLVATGPVAISGTTLTGFDMGARMSAVEKLAGMKGGPNTEIQTLSANVKASQSGGMSLNNIDLVAPSIGELTGAGTISPSNALNFRLSVKVHAAGVLAIASRTSIPVLVKGTASNPVFAPDVGALATQEVKTFTSDATKAGGLLGGLLGQRKK